MTLEHSLIEYPSDFPIKVFGQSQEGFSRAVMEVILRHDPDFQAASIISRNSKTSRYVSLTCTVRATSREQLDAIYQDLCDNPMVVMAL
ncbi:MAG: DUF493 domain-containing protein [Gallionellaceae bacterium]|jgi:hypothetical protein